VGVAALNLSISLACNTEPVREDAVMARAKSEIQHIIGGLDQAASSDPYAFDLQTVNGRCACSVAVLRYLYGAVLPATGTSLGEYLMAATVGQVLNMMRTSFFRSIHEARRLAATVPGACESQRV